MRTFWGLDKKKSYVPDELDKHSQKSGAEAFVYDVIGDPTIKLKVYKEGLTIGTFLEKKLIRMVQMGQPRSSEGYELAWPTDVLYEDGRFVGYVMPNLIGYDYSLYHIYNREDKIKLDWYQRIYAAFGLATIIGELHAKGVMLVDFNDANFLYNKDKGKFGVIDCGQFQIAQESTLPFFDDEPPTCDPEFQPPEYFKRILPRSIEAFIAWDDFNLANKLFCLLMPHSLPFFGDENQIVSGECLYVRDVPDKEIPDDYDKPGLLPLDILGLFNKTFNYTENTISHNIKSRASAEDWCRVLYKYIDESNKQKLLKKCDNCKDIYSLHLPECPWCHPEGVDASPYEERIIKDPYHELHLKNSNNPQVKREETNKDTPCPCGSGKKYGKCCGQKIDSSNASAPTPGTQSLSTQKNGSGSTPAPILGSSSLSTQEKGSSNASVPIRRGNVSIQKYIDGKLGQKFDGYRIKPKEKYRISVNYTTDNPSCSLYTQKIIKLSKGTNSLSTTLKSNGYFCETNDLELKTDSRLNLYRVATSSKCENGVLSSENKSDKNFWYEVYADTALGHIFTILKKILKNRTLTFFLRWLAVGIIVGVIIGSRHQTINPNVLYAFISGNSEQAYSIAVENGANYYLDNLGDKYMEVGDYAKAQECYEKFTECYPKKTKALKKLVGICLENEDNDSFEKYANKLLDLDPDCKEMDIYSKLGSINFDKGKETNEENYYLKAIEYYTKAFNNDENDAISANMMGRSYYSILLLSKDDDTYNNSYTNALKWYHTAEKIDNEESVFSGNVGLVYKYNKEYNSAEEQFVLAAGKAVSKKDDNHSGYYYALAGYCAVRMENFGIAEDYFNSAQQYNPDKQYIENIIKELKRLDSSNLVSREINIWQQKLDSKQVQ